MKFDFSKSDNADLQNKFQLELDTMRKNILYITHRVDAIMSLCRKINTDTSLQKQVDDYMENEKSLPLEDMAQDGNHQSD